MGATALQVTSIILEHGERARQCFASVSPPLATAAGCGVGLEVWPVWWEGASRGACMNFVLYSGPLMGSEFRWLASQGVNLSVLNTKSEQTAQ